MECKINAESSFGLEKGFTIHNLTLRLVKEAIHIVFNSNFRQCLTIFYARDNEIFQKIIIESRVLDWKFQNPDFQQFADADQIQN